MTKLIVIEGTDCSGKETQANLLRERLEKDNIKIAKRFYPNYDSPTGKIVGGPYLGKDYICEGWFPEGAPNVDYKIASLYYAADRKYDASNVNKLIDDGYNVILDRYTFSNMAHQGGKETDKMVRLGIYDWMDKLEFGFLKLRIPDIKILLYMPYDSACILKEKRMNIESIDQHESSPEHLKAAERAYLEVASKYHFKIINCVKDGGIRSIDDIHEEIYNYIKGEIVK